ncbi:MAG: DsbC family protein [Candidatus Competibacteraceae bacterium]|jgi:thiol:disulfide interchange protein DsbC|nr:DsbC family protein [Candidatus Competibacteraceae bacterium]
MMRNVLLAFIAMFLVPVALAADPVEPNLTKLQKAIGDVVPDSVSPTAVPGIYEVLIGSQILYLSEDGGFVFQGELIDLGNQANLTADRRNGLRAKAIDAVGEDNMVIFAPDGKSQHTVSIFTDIDCGYCRQLHRQIADYTERGITVRYLMFPRAGVDSESYKKAVSVWCSENRKDAMTRAKAGEEIEPKSCDNPVEQQFALGSDLGVRGTPSIILESGEMVPGYVPADRLAQLLNEDGNNN